MGASPQGPAGSQPGAARAVGTNSPPAPAKRLMKTFKTYFLVMLFLFCGCDSSPSPLAQDRIETRAAGKDGWLQGSTHKQIDTIARHLRGNDLAMWEVGYRYGELFWSGSAGNWALAAYQIKKIRLTMELAIQRRPARAPSYANFFEDGLTELNTAIHAKDLDAFDRSFRQLTSACNACHAAEKLEFFRVQKPTSRSAPLGPR